MGSCTLRAGWSCNQPGRVGYDDVIGPVRIPGPGGTFLHSNTTGALLGWGAVPLSLNFSCWCANAAGTFSEPSLDCAAVACPFPARCVDRWPQAIKNGTVCSLGSEGSSCAVCSKHFYRWLDTCRPCPNNQGAIIVLLVIFTSTLTSACVLHRRVRADAPSILHALRTSTVVVLVIGPYVSSVFSAETVATIRNSLQYLQFLAHNLHIPLPGWPPALLAFFKYVYALIDGIQLAAPECYSDTWNCAHSALAPCGFTAVEY